MCSIFFFKPFLLFYLFFKFFDVIAYTASKEYLNTRIMFSLAWYGQCD